MIGSIFEELKSEELYHLYKTNSTQINKELIQKFKDFPVLTDFFKHFTNIDIKLLNENINLFFLQISSIGDLSSLNSFQLSVEQYISDFSQLYLVLNVICKINESIDKIVRKINSSMPKLFEKHCLDKDFQNKINEIVKYMLGTNNKIKFSTNSNLDNSGENTTDNKSKSTKILKNKKIELLKDLFNKEMEYHQNKLKSLENLRFNIDLIHINTDYSLSNKKSEISKNESQLIKMNSIASEFTFNDSNLKQNKEKSNDNLNIKENIENKDDNILSEDINDYITSIPKDSILTKIKSVKKRSLYKSCKDLTSKTFRDNKTKNFEIHQEDKIVLHDSSEKLIANEDSKMYANLLEIIYELYQNKKITYEQKVNLKKLIIKKNPKILDVYKKFQHIDNEKLAEDLKELV